MNNKYLIVFVVSFAALFQSMAEAKSVPRGNAGESRIRQVNYDPNQAVEVEASFGYATTVEFGNETIQTAVSGDTIGWQVVPKGNRLFIKPAERPQKGLNGTNITVITDKRNYYLHVYIGDRSNPVFVVRFNYDAPKALTASSVLSTPTIDADDDPSAPATRKASPTAKIKPYRNYNYKMDGAKNIDVKKVFDDGQFTYIEFNPAKPMPAIFGVNEKGNEELVNFRQEGKYTVVERVGMLFSLRIGDAVKCVRNFSYKGV